jgi:multiple sugar transport system permease protein
MRRRSWLGLPIVGVLALVMLAPFIYMVATSLREDAGAYANALNAQPFPRFFFNSFLLAGGAALGQVLTSATAAYAFARLRFPGRDCVFFAFLSILVMPAVVLLVPRFLMINAMGWVDTYPGLISTELVSVWGIFFLRQAFLSLPRDLEDAARLDGAGEWTIFWHVTLPLAKPALATLGLLAFVDQWKNFLWPLVATRSLEMQVAEVALARFHGLYPGNWPGQLAAAVAVTLPLLIVFFVAQRYVIRGLPLAATRS